MKGHRFPRWSLWTAIFVSATFVVSSLPALVYGEEGNSLQLAEEAYAQVDFELTLRHTGRALEEGNYDREQLARIYELRAMCAAAIDQFEVAHSSYMRMLALDPEAEVSETVAPDIRAVFLEAVGSWVSRGGNLSAEVTLVRNRGDLRVNVSDPLTMGNTIVLMFRIAGDADFTEVREPSAERVYFNVLGSEETDYVEVILRVIDEHDNSIIELGDEEEPLRVGERPAVLPSGLNQQSGPAQVERPLTRRAWFWVVIGTTVLAVAGGGGALGWYLWDRANTINSETEITIGIR